MTRPLRLLILSLVLLGLLLLIAFLPLRLALEWSGLAERGLAAREVQGSIWSGRLVDSRFGATPLGTLDASLNPVSLFGTPMVAVSRAETAANQQPLSANMGGGSGRLVIASANGDIPLDQVSDTLPVAALRLNNVALTMEDGRCQSASGEVQLVLNHWLGRFAAQNGLRGPVQCDGDALAVSAQGQSGMEKLSFRLEPDGRYRAELAVQGLSDDLAAGLRGLGFAQQGDRMVLVTDGAVR